MSTPIYFFIDKLYVNNINVYTIETINILLAIKQRKIKRSKGGVTLALIVTRNFGPRDDSLPRQRDKRVARLGHKKGKTDLFFFQRSPPRLPQIFPFYPACSMRGPETRAAFPQRGIYNFGSFSLIARNSGIRINNCFCRKFYCVSAYVRVRRGWYKGTRAGGFMAKKFSRTVHILACPPLLNCSNSVEVIARQICDCDSRRFFRKNRNRR